MKYLITFIVLGALAAIIYGLTILKVTPSLGHKCIGFGTIALFLVAMPLFLIKESKGKNMQDYMLTKENIEKMRNKERQNKVN